MVKVKPSRGGILTQAQNDRAPSSAERHKDAMGYERLGAAPAVGFRIEDHSRIPRMAANASLRSAALAPAAFPGLEPSE
jgi:hypothetical protein